MESEPSTLCKVIAPVRIYGKGYKAGDKVEILNTHLNHFGKSVEPVKIKTQENNKGEK